ncbi:MAG: hypothetical protein WCO78_01770 [Candidatus Roizmanbacteria bacterium]
MKHLVLFLVGLLLVSTVSVAVQAESSSQDREDTPETRTEVRTTIAPLLKAVKEKHDAEIEARETAAPLREATKTQLKENVAAARCTKVTANIDQRIAKFESDHNGRVKVFTTIKERVQARLTALKARGIDVTTLEANLVTLQTKIDKLTTDHTAYMEKLKATKAFVCGQSQGEFKTALEAARDAQKVVFTDAKDIIAFIKDTLKPNLEAIRALITPPAKLTPTVSLTP